MSTRRTGWVVVVILLALGLLPPIATAQEENQAALVIQFADGRTETWCIPFEGDTISGDELLARSELEILIDPSSGMGITVCRIEGLGCGYPAEHCFCQCMGGESCAYWNYFYRDPGGETWTYSPLGALLREVPPGGMEAWVWGDGKTPPAADLTFETVCAPLEPTLEPAATAATDTPSPLPAETATSVVDATPTAPADTGTRVAVEATNTPTSLPATATVPPPTLLAPAETVVARNEPQSETGSYWAFVLILVVLGVVGLFVLLRQRRGRGA